MTTISGVSGAYATQPAHWAQPPQRDRQDPMAKVAGALGMTSEELKNELTAGKSLNQVAEAKGIDHDTLVAAIKEGLPTAGDGSRKVDTTQLAEKIAAQQGPPPGRGSGGPPPGGPAGNLNALTDTDTLDKLSSLLETDSKELTATVKSPKDLVELFQKKGVDVSALRDVLNGKGNLVDVSL
ncbi:hypothetical protein Val02_59890 [Virgisporangium aliadipatigenens]|uniref:Uncharacterized protein n=1 Tax=Virgisporangium aliadipatigenens TaxID=741659 RepID=A0A8J3YSS9_9ACTN|nr:hypothetical protein [Virgisporangium aliadipatigenens]GIJ49103.1 hypothetical protein Val02_59890 [Virgisporangium aliadipatigenens]